MSLLDHARRELSRHLGDVDLSGMPEAGVRSGVNALILGGWQRMAEEYRRDLAAKASAESDTPSPVQVRLIAAKWLGRRHLREYDEVKDLQVSENRRVLVVSFAVVEHKATFDYVGARVLQINVWTRNPETFDWDLSRTEVINKTEEKHYRAHGAVNTPERDAEQREQVETCYRPGTSSAPMDGWVRRLEVSHKDVHPDMYSPKS